MVQQNRTGSIGGALALSGVSAIMSTIAVLQGGSRASAAPGGKVSLDDDTLNLLMAMAQGTADIDQLLGEIFNAMRGIGNEPGEQSFSFNVQGYPSNTQSIIATRVQIQALNQAYQLPDIPVPNGMALQLKGWPTNGGLIYVGSSAATARNANQAWPLLANEPVGYYVTNAMNLYVSGTAVGDFVGITVERR